MEQRSTNEIRWLAASRRRHNHVATQINILVPFSVLAWDTHHTCRHSFSLTDDMQSVDSPWVQRVHAWVRREPASSQPLQSLRRQLYPAAPAAESAVHAHSYDSVSTPATTVRPTSANITTSLYYLTLWCTLLPYGYSYKASCARPR